MPTTLLCTEVRGAPLTNFQKKKKYEGLLSIYKNQSNRSNFMHELYRVVKVSKRDRTCWKKPHICFKTRFLKKKISLLILNISIALILWKKKLLSLYNFRTYFFPLVEFDVSFLNLLSTTLENQKWIFLAN